MDERLERWPEGPLFLGVECGGTRTVALWTDGGFRLQHRAEAGPANLRLMTDGELRGLFRSLARQVAAPSAVGVGMAGAREESDRQRIRAAAEEAWPGAVLWVGNDLDTALAAASGPAGCESSDRADRSGPAARVVVISGTGSCCYGRSSSGVTAKVGGWGHLLGDRGSGYDLGLSGLREAVATFDETGQWPELGERVLARLQLNEPNDLVSWLLKAQKGEVASLAVDVFALAGAGDRLARGLVERAALALASDATACARRLVSRGRFVEFVLTGGVHLKQAAFARAVRRELGRRWPRCRVRLLECEGVWGAVRLAERAWASLGAEVGAGRVRRGAVRSAALPVLDSLVLSPTERRNPGSRNLDRMSVAASVELMLSEDAAIPAALRHERVRIVRAIGLITEALRRGGRLFYVGAGTSGRLGVLDASECPPTFRTPADLVQGVMAGGASALVAAAEGAEDDVGAGGRSMVFRGVSRKDVVVGIAASGRTPFVWGALAEAKRRGAATVLLCFNPTLRIGKADRPTVVIAADVGPEILTGSTRLKAGTATKLVLNMFSTLAMVRLGKVVSNLMVDLSPSNVKLRDRAARIVSELAGVDVVRATEVLRETDWVVKRALLRLGRRCRG